MAQAGINEVMYSKDVVRGESIRDEKREKDWTMEEERIEVIEGTESDTGIMSDLGEGNGEIEMITESTKIGEERIVVGETRDVEGIDSDTRIVSDLEEGDREIEIIIESTKIGEGRVDEEGKAFGCMGRYQ